MPSQTTESPMVEMTASLPSFLLSWQSCSSCINHKVFEQQNERRIWRSCILVLPFFQMWKLSLRGKGMASQVYSRVWGWTGVQAQVSHMCAFHCIAIVSDWKRQDRLGSKESMSPGLLILGREVTISDMKLVWLDVIIFSTEANMWGKQMTINANTVK